MILKKIKKIREKIKQGIDVVKERKKTKPKPKTVGPPEIKKIKTFDEYKK